MSTALDVEKMQALRPMMDRAARLFPQRVVQFSMIQPHPLGTCWTVSVSLWAGETDDGYHLFMFPCQTNTPADVITYEEYARLSIRAMHAGALLMAEQGLDLHWHSERLARGGDN